MGALHRERATGVLELVEWSGATAGRRHRVVFAAGLVLDVDTRLSVPRLGDILRQAGFLDAAGTRLLVRRLAERPQQRAGQILVDSELVARSAVAAALRHQLRHKLDALSSLSDARVGFHVARPVRPGVAAVPLSPREFLHGRTRARDRGRPRQQGGTSLPHEPQLPDATPPRRQDPVRASALRVLGLGPGADADSVRRAFRRLAAEVHPDRHPTASPHEVTLLLRRFAELSAAYHRVVA